MRTEKKKGVVVVMMTVAVVSVVQEEDTEEEEDENRGSRKQLNGENRTLKGGKRFVPFTIRIKINHTSPLLFTIKCLTFVSNMASAVRHVSNMAYSCQTYKKHSIQLSSIF